LLTISTGLVYYRGLGTGYFYWMGGYFYTSASVFLNGLSFLGTAYPSSIFLKVLGTSVVLLYLIQLLSF
jgi:hypothetical protein